MLIGQKHDMLIENMPDVDPLSIHDFAHTYFNDYHRTPKRPGKMGQVKKSKRKSKRKSKDQKVNQNVNKI